MSKKKLAISAIITIFTLFSFNLYAFASTGESNNNLISNGGFEQMTDEVPSDWEATVWDSESTTLIGTSTEEVRSGNYSVYINNTESNDARYCQTIAVEPDSYYKISVYVYAKDVTGGDVGANIGLEDSTVHSDSVFDTDGQWKQIVMYGKTGSEQYDLNIGVRLGGYNSTVTGEAWFDDFSIEKLESSPALTTVEDLSPTISSVSEEETTTRAENVTDLDLYVTFIFVGLLFALFFFYLYTKTGKRERLSIEPKDEVLNIGIALIIAMFVRLILAVLYGSHGNDISTFEYWASAIGNNGISSFYTSGFFADYPPGYMYILGGIGSLMKVFSVSTSSAVYALAVKSPAMICDLITAFVIYKIARKKLSANVSFLLLLAFAFNPAAIFNSAGWGQIDSILTLTVVLSLYYLYKKELIKSLIIFALALLIKPQAILFAPVIGMFLIAYYLKSDKQARGKLLKHFAIGIVFATVIFTVLVLPFKGSQSFGWLFSKYMSTTSQYDYATINAANLFGLLGANWKDASDIFIFMSYRSWGIIFIALVSIVLIIYMIKNKPEIKHIFLIASAYLFAVFMLGQYMHERYYYPLIVLLLIAYIMEKDRRLLHVFVVLSITLLINQGQALGLYPTIPSYDVIYLTCSALNIYTLGWLLFLTYDITIRNKIATFEQYVDTLDDTPENEDLNLLNETEPKGVLNWTKKDTKIILILTLVYACIAFYNLGNMSSPQTYWRSRNVGDEVVLKLPTTTHLDELTYFSNICDGKMEIEVSTDGINYEKETTVDLLAGDIYKWNTKIIYCDALYIKIKTTQASVWLNEIGFYSNGEPVTGITVVSQSVADPYEGSDAANLVDEQSELSLYKTNMNGFYFDEIYHARTAYEHLHGLKPYEISHPPLGKLLISCGIAIFGMTPFGWRFTGALFGVLMIPLMYLFAKRIFNGSSRYAFITAFLFAFDFMHFTQTRIATIDVYGVFFIIAMYYFMYKYFVMSYNTSSLKKTFVPLFFCGLSFGLGCASKWIGVYAGGGLAVLFFVALYQRYEEYKYAKEGLSTYNIDDNESELSLIKKNQYEQVVASFKGKTIKTLLFCVPVFIIMPLTIYLLSFIPYMTNVEDPYTLQMIWQEQIFMFNYHSGLTQGHPYSSQWYEWPFMIRDVWYYKGEGQPEGMYSTIAALGNPAVWYSALVGTVYAIIAYALNWIKKEKELFFLIVGLSSQFLPWVLVTRATFLYHYFASLPFIILILVYIIRKKEAQNKKFRRVTYALLALTAILFVVFYPAISGMPVSEFYISCLRWLPSWWF